MRRYPLLFLLFLLHYVVLAQPDPCGDAPAMTSTCLEACVICDIDGFTGRNNSNLRGQRVGNFCTTFNHNMGFIAFIAGTENLRIEVEVRNCNPSLNTGLEIGLFESFDCENFVSISDCNTNVRPNTTVPFSNTVPLVVGQHYYLIMDGSSGDVCDWTFRVVEGSTAVGELTTSGTLGAVRETCPEFPTRFETTGVEPGAALFYWSVNGVRQRTTNRPEADLAFPADGSYEVCVVAANVCDEAPPSCRQINVRSPGVTRWDSTICQDQFIEVADTILRTSGDFDFQISLPNGCDSLIFVELEVLPQTRQFIDINLCVGEEFFIGDTPYSTTGLFQDTILTVSACDSIVTLDLFMIECEIRGSTSFQPPICRGEANGRLFFSVENGTPPFTYDWSNILQPASRGNGTTDLLINNEITGVPAGTYEINVRDGFGNDVVFFQTVTEPADLVLALAAEEIDGFNLSCFASADGQASVVTTGGITPYQYAWSNGANRAVNPGLPAGPHTVTVTDANACAREATLTLRPPPPIAYTVVYTDPNCDGLETGTVELTNSDGGTPPFRAAFNGGEFDTLTRFTALRPGAYSFAIIDANGCREDTVGTLEAPDIPVIFPWGPITAELGCATRLTTRINAINVAAVRWSGPAGTLSCDTCLSPDALPLNDAAYSLTVTSADGCATTDSLTIKVLKFREVFAPTAFSPNGDGVNDRFGLGVNKAVTLIRALRIFDRWGEQVFAGTDLPPNDLSVGWDGQLNDRPMNPGFYAWSAEVVFLDGEVQVLSGEVMLLR